MIFSIPLLVATGVLLAGLLGQLWFRQGPKGGKRILAWLVLLCATLGLAIALFSSVAVARFRGSLRHLEQLSEAEWCNLNTGNNKTTAGLHAFEEWANHVRYAQDKGKHPERGGAFASASGKECELRLPDEPLVHYRWRRLERHLSGVAGSFKEIFAYRNRGSLGSFWDLLELKLHLKQIDVEEMLDHNGGEPDFHVAWSDLSPIMSQEVSEVAKLLFISRVPGAPTMQTALPAIRWGVDPSICTAMVTDSDGTPETRTLRRHLEERAKTCEKRREMIASYTASQQDKNACAPEIELPDACNWESVRRTINFVCILKSKPGTSLSVARHEIHWKDIPEALHFGIQTIYIPEDFLPEDFLPENFLSGVDPDLLSYRRMKLTYELARVFDPGFVYQTGDDELASDPRELQYRTKLAIGQGMTLTRLGVATSLISPFMSDSFPKEVEVKFQWGDVYGRLSGLLSQFRVAYRRHHAIPLKVSAKEAG